MVVSKVNDTLTSEQKLKLISDEFQIKLQKVADNIVEKSVNAHNESETVQEFIYEIKKFVSNEFGIEIHLLTEASESVLDFKFKGRMDAVSHSLVLEFKHESKLRTENQKKDAHDQILKYLIQLYENEGVKYRGILTDGVKIRYYYFIDNEIKFTSFSDLDGTDISTIITSLLSADDKRFDVSNIVNDFQLKDRKSVTLNLARNLYNSIVSEEMDPRTEALFEDWMVLFNLSEQDSGKSADIRKRREALGKIFNVKIENNKLDFLSLFVLQTTYSIIVKLIASKILPFQLYNQDRLFFEDLSELTTNDLKFYMEALENGDTYPNEGYVNLLEGDYFSWYSYDFQWNKEIAKSIKEVIKILEGYSYITFKDEYAPMDIFKDLYMEIMPNAVRHSLGEYFTPSWLADKVVTDAINQVQKDNWRLIDPTCGSGIFLVTAIKKIISEYTISDLTKEDKNLLINRITKRVLGVDINPLSTLTARVGYFIAVLPLITEETSFEIPVYLGDSAIVGDTINLDGVECYSVITNSSAEPIVTTLPVSLVSNRSFFSKMETLSKKMIQFDKKRWVDELKKDIQDSDKNQLVIEELEKFADMLFNLKDEGLSHTWMRIVSNQMKISSIKSVDIIAGNPPWVKWEHLPQVYANTLKERLIDKHLFSGQRYMGAISLNLCALIASVTASKWLEKEGILAFLMPKTMLTQDSYAGFRNFYIDYENNTRLYLQHLDDWSKAGHPFIYTTEPFSTFYYSRNLKDYHEEGVEVNFYKKKKNLKIEFINTFHTFWDVTQFYDKKIGSLFQLDKERTGFTIFESEKSIVAPFKTIIGKSDYKARSGVEFTPYEIYTFEVSEIFEGNSKIARFKNYKSKGTIHKATNGGVSGHKLETDFIRPLIKGPKIEPFKINFENEYGIFPYDPQTTQLVDEDIIEQNTPKLMRYLLDNKATIDNQSERSKMMARGDQFYSLSKIGEYTFAENIVAFRDNSKMAAAVLSPIKTHWGEKLMPICAKHAPYISMDMEGDFISEDEAYYLAAILNTNIVASYFKYTYSSRSYSINFNIKMPKYNPNDENHKKLCDLSKKAHQVTNSFELNELVHEMDVAYKNLCQDIVF